MNRNALIVAVIALIIGLTSIFLASCNLNINNRKKTVPYEIKGSIELVNDCDSNLASLPETVEVKSLLINKKGDVSIGGSVIVPVTPDPTDPVGNPRKIGNYSITVNWDTDSGGIPAFWTPPKATRENGDDICEIIICIGAETTHDCKKVLATKANVPFVNPTTTSNISITCICVMKGAG